MNHFLICRRFKFDAAHKIPSHQGKCKNLHGHSWAVDVSLTGDLICSGPQSGMVMDFGELKNIMSEILESYDHQCLNDFIALPTAETLCSLIEQALSLKLPENIKVYSIKVWESGDSYAEYRPTGF